MQHVNARTGWLIAMMFTLAASGDPVAVAQSANGDVEKLVRALDDQERIAALKRDVAAIDRLWSADFTVNAPNNQVVVGKAAVLDTFIKSGIIDFASFDRRVEFVRVAIPFVFVMGLETLVPNASAPGAGLVAGQRVERRFTNIWRNEDGTWRLFARHANVIPAR
jgi:ketosteroid isomerase-like protein